MIVQDAMARGLAELAAASDADAMIMAGDFNSPERGQPVRRVRAAGLRSVHASRGRGLGATWPRVTWLKHLPGTRIDQILFRDLEVIDCGVGEDFGSDHRPVWAVFQAP
jgi:endonuclease/exonuclease/phosphatase (EEP) superfamily protein YafD